MNQDTQHTNRLATQASLYLQQHAHNPVDWFPWGEEALQKARVEDKPILLSIGYSSCHWCHVMAHESFEDAATAALMNEHFVNIKVDREERPDLDDIYMTAVQALAGSGGWPMTVFLTPDGRPFYGGTYFPPEDRHGLPGFRRLLGFLAERFQSRRDEIEDVTDEMARAIDRGLRASGTAGPISDGLLASAREQLMAAYEPRYGGFSVRPKFPQPMTLRLLLQLAGDDVDAKTAAIYTLDQMIAGGMYDLVGGGFHRYSVDEKWLVPHFEKMLYDNAQLALTYLEGYAMTDDPRYRSVVVETLNYLLREMQLEAGGFAAAQDADTPEGEGRFYAWTQEEFADAVGEEDAGWALEYFGLTARGNYHGMTLPRQVMSVEELAQRLGITEEETYTRLDDVRDRLRAAREANHIRPERDGKLLVDWNGLAISALARAGHLFASAKYLDAGRLTADFILREMRTDGRLNHFYAGGGAHGNAFLSDYANLIAGLIALNQATGEARWLVEAEALTQVVIEHFWDAHDGGFFFTGDDHEALLARPKNFTDLPVPSGNSVMAMNLLRLAGVLGRTEWRELARETIERFADAMRGSAQGLSYMLLALDQYYQM